jgi:hypothetical protein
MSSTSSRENVGKKPGESVCCHRASMPHKTVRHQAKQTVPNPQRYFVSRSFREKADWACLSLLPPSTKLPVGCRRQRHWVTLPKRASGDFLFAILSWPYLAVMLHGPRLIATGACGIRAWVAHRIPLCLRELNVTAARVARCGLASDDAKATDQNLIRRKSGAIANDAIDPGEQPCNNVGGQRVLASC